MRSLVRPSLGLAILLCSSAIAADLSISGPSTGDTGVPVRVAVNGLPQFPELKNMYAFEIGVAAKGPEGVDISLEQSMAYDLVKQTWKLLIDLTADNSGVYDIVVGYKPDKLELLIHRVTIGKQPGPIPPDPIPPDPIPPDPVPPPSDFVAQIKGAFMLVGMSAHARGADIGKNYLTIADQATTNPTAWTPATMLDTVKARHSTVLTIDEMRAWMPFWRPLAIAFISLKLDASDLDGHIKAFRTIGETLNDLATIGTARH